MCKAKISFLSVRRGVLWSLRPVGDLELVVWGGHLGGSF